jgi:predicted  nucleic acid-binding Zn-ribbon protein
MTRDDRIEAYKHALEMLAEEEYAARVDLVNARAEWERISEAMVATRKRLVRLQDEPVTQA